MKTAYLRFCLHFGLKPVPASPATIILYTAFIARSLKNTSIPGYLNIIRLMHIDMDVPNPLGGWELAMVKKGINRTLGSPPQQKLPISPEILLLIRRQLNFQRNRDKAFWCACLLAFFSFLRKASLLPKSSRIPTADCLCQSDLQLEDALLYLTVRHTKTIQFGQRILKIPIAAISGSPLCPLVATVNMLDSLPAPAAGSQPLFTYIDTRGVTTCLDYASFVKDLKTCLGKAGFPPGDYSGHSFRRGGCTFAFKVGVPAPVIKLRGDWKSNAYERYISINDSVNVKCARALSLTASYAV